MSYPFHLNDVQVWDPALKVGKLFLAQAGGVAEVLGVPSGLTPLREGTCAVDPRVFPAFAERLARACRDSPHPVWLALTHGVLVVSVVILRRSGIALPPDLPESVLAGAGEMDSAMAR